ncbi:MAG: hypothetical protein KAS32_03205, partial [Candidatus Peribacteraceae bacterium]|nr:hypothetical protein [Candidatus Peribacteraceae bacterium]
ELIYHDEKRVIMKALIYDSDVVVATVYAEEIRSQSNINKTSAMENCETSCIGRAIRLIEDSLDPYASADEVLRAVEQQEELPDSAETTTKSSDNSTSESIITDDNTKVITEDSGDNTGVITDEWTSSIPDDILDVVKENYKMVEKYHKDAAEWHGKVLPNFLSERVGEEEHVIDAIKRLSREKLAELAVIQNDRLKLNKED